MVKDYAFSLSLGTTQEHHIGSHHFYSSSVLDTGAVTIRGGGEEVSIEGDKRHFELERKK